MANKKESKNSNKQENKQNMNVINKLLENVSGIRTLPRPDIGDQIPVAKKGDTLSDILNNDINVSSVLSIGELDTFRTLSRDREKLYKTFDQMMQDSVVSTVIEIYADEVCQYNEDGKIIWAESDDKDVSKYVNDLLEKLKIEDNCWDHIYQLVYLGDLYLETFDNLHPANLHKSDILRSHIEVEVIYNYKIDLMYYKKKNILNKLITLQIYMILHIVVKLKDLLKYLKMKWKWD